MKPFRFQQFEVLQSKDVFRVGTDAVLLGALSNLDHPKKILEVGCGSGIISLMLAQRFLNAKIIGIDINPVAVALSRENFENSIFCEKLETAHCDYNQFSPLEKFDAVVCNPPFFEENSSQKDIIARQKKHLNFTALIQKTAEIISEQGIFSVILPVESTENFVEICEKHQFHLQRKINIFGIENGFLKRNIIEFSRIKTETKTQDFTIEKSPRKYSEEYLEITKNFHIFNSK